MSDGDPRFHALLKELGELHDRKQADYGRDDDPLANIRGSLEWGIQPWVGALVRLNDKVRRLQRYAQKGSLANESAEDSMKDIAVYALLALILKREQDDGSKRVAEKKDSDAYQVQSEGITTPNLLGRSLLDRGQSWWSPAASESDHSCRNVEFPDGSHRCRVCGRRFD